MFRRDRELAAWIVVAMLTITGLAWAPGAFAQTATVPGWDVKIVAFLTALVPLVGALQGLGLITKYVPIKALGYVNNHLIPLGQTLLTFLLAFGGTKEVVSLVTGAGYAEASFLGITIGPQLGFLAKAAASMAVGMFSRNVFEMYFRPLAEGVFKWQNNETLVGRAEAKI